MPGLRHRVRQFLGALRPKISEADKALVEGKLSPELVDLFFRMTPRDQAHCLAMARRLLSEGPCDELLVQAALLHDVGKAAGPRPVKLWERVAFVLLSALPSLRDALAGDLLVPRLRGFYLLKYHAQLGAEMVEASGGSSELARLVRDHHTSGDDHRLRVLRDLDGAVP